MYTLLVQATADSEVDPYSHASFDVQLDAVPAVASVPMLGPGATLLLGVGLAGTAARALVSVRRRARSTREHDAERDR